MAKSPHALKHNDCFAVFDEAGALQGLFHHDTRHLARLDLTIDGEPPGTTRTRPSEDNTLLLTALRHRQIALSRIRFVWQDCLHERLRLRNAGAAAHRVTLDLAFAADFADLFEVRGHDRARRGETLPASIAADHVVLAYRGLDGRMRTTRLAFDPPPLRLVESGARFELDLAPHTHRSLFVRIACECAPSPGGGRWRATARRKGDVEDGLLRSSSTSPFRPSGTFPLRGKEEFFDARRAARRRLRDALARATAVSCADPAIDAVVQRGIIDLYTLVSELPEGPYPHAGIPWFNTVFGRDGLIAALQTLWLDPGIARGVLGHLAATQAATSDPAADAEPGKILHEARQCEMAALGEVPFARYYGSVDATPLFVMLAGAYLRRTGDIDTLRRLWPNVQRALAWIESRGDGFVTYERQSERGLRNQGWKDSPDSVFHADGTLAEGAIALCEVQAYVYAAWRAAAAIARRLGEPDADRYEARAESLRRAFDTHFFDERLGTYVPALDGERRPCRVRASNAGHALFTGIAWPERAAAVVRGLMEQRSFSGWGIRTVAAGEARYDPGSYHNGSVWPHDNALIAAGFARYGFRREAALVSEAVFAAAAHFKRLRLPELFGGDARRDGQGPTPYPGACSPQAWAASAPLLLLHVAKGNQADERP
ncbi:MAG: amylo-alpha-1,6-glucosidase [Alphaproteobacteria bacterium]|nr:amylo-alpha-1,6-glucosidase [Alphaproteobacteria bacterium]MCW5742516.1 amylo-alpha-1,6-glucosidase [Alphaproteobacteria bacterium]